jgi:hypothetical protein
MRSSDDRHQRSSEHLGLMATGGIEVIASAARRLAALDRKLTVRSPSAKLLHLLDATLVTDLGQDPGAPAWTGMSNGSPTFP